MKATLVEHLNRTLKGLMVCYFTRNHTLRWIDVLDDSVYSYNNRGHRSLAYRSPASVTKENQKYFWQLQFNDDKKITTLY